MVGIGSFFDVDAPATGALLREQDPWIRQGSICVVNKWGQYKEKARIGQSLDQFAQKTYDLARRRTFGSVDRSEPIEVHR